MKIYFDLDGTLIDIKKAQRGACRSLYSEYSFEKVTDLESFCQTWDTLTEYHYAFYTEKKISYDEQRIRRIEGLFEYYGCDAGGVSPLGMYASYLEHFENNWTLYDDVLPCLERLQDMGVAMGVLTNGDLAQQKMKTIKTGINTYFEHVIAAGEYSYSKPDLRIFQNMLAVADIGSKDMIYCGDDYEKDIVPCQALGIRGVWLNRGGTSDAMDGYGMTVGTLGRLLDYDDITKF